MRPNPSCPEAVVVSVSVGTCCHRGLDVSAGGMRAHLEREAIARHERHEGVVVASCWIESSESDTMTTER